MIFVNFDVKRVYFPSSLLSQTYMQDGECVSDFLFKGPLAETMYLLFAVFAFFFLYAIPCACFFILYGMVVISMQRRKRDSQFETNT